MIVQNYFPKHFNLSNYKVNSAILLLFELIFGSFSSAVVAQAEVQPSDLFLEWSETPATSSNKELPVDDRSRLSQSAAAIAEMDVSPLKVSLLNNLALNYADLGDLEEAGKLLEQSQSAAAAIDDISLAVISLTRVADSYYEIGRERRALEILESATVLADSADSRLLQAQLLLTISLKYGDIGRKKTAGLLFARSQALIDAASQPVPEFPFAETSAKIKLGFVGQVRSFRDTTGYVGLSANISKQWAEDDFYLDGNIYVDIDSSRSVNNYRPGSLVLGVYRHHFDADWNFFTDVFVSTNQDFFSSSNNDEDLEIIAATYAGVGLNLWRGKTPNNFLDLQLGIGARYIYDYVSFEQLRNEMNPAAALILYGRDFSLGALTLNQTFAFAPLLNDFNDYVVSSDTRLAIRLSERWSLTNRLFLRYRNEKIVAENPQLNFFFLTGIEYEF